MILFLKLMWWKWVKRGCPHVCVWCIYRCRCWSELFDEPEFDTIRKDVNP